MKRHILVLLALTVSALATMGNSCVLEDTSVEVPVRTNADLSFEARGDDAGDSGSATLNFTSVIADAERDVDISALVGIHVENGYWRVTRNGGNLDLAVSVTVTVTRTATGETQDLLHLDGVPIASVLGDFQAVPLDSAGVRLLNDGFQAYLDARNAGGALPDLTYRFDWTTTVAPAPPPAVDFDWEARIKLSIVGTVTVQVPEVL